MTDRKQGAGLSSGSSAAVRSIEQLPAFLRNRLLHL